MTFLIIILASFFFFLALPKLFRKLNLKNEFKLFSNSIKELGNKNIEYTEVLDEISLTGIKFLIVILFALFPWIILSTLGYLFELNKIIVFLLASFPYISLLKIRKK